MEYFKLTLFILATILISSTIILLSFFKSRKIKNTHNQCQTYECGFDSNPAFFKKFDVKFYLVAILFIIFDLEIAFLFPWAISLSLIGLVGYLSMMIFLLILTVGFVYEWKKGALDWE